MKRGQVAIFLVMALVGIVLLAMANFRFYTIFVEKMHRQNAIDSAAVRVAQYQGRLINEIGRLNIRHMGLQRPDEADEVVLEQRRLCLLGPLDAYIEGQKQAEHKGLAPRELNENNTAYKVLMDHADEVVEMYEQGDPYEPSYPGAWGEYVNKIYEAASQAKYMTCVSVEFCNYGDHILTDPDFYAAVAAKDWCWFYFNAYDYLKNFSNYSDWPELDFGEKIDTVNCEFFSLHLSARQCALASVYSPEEIARMNPDYNQDIVEDPKQWWFFYSGSFMGEWSRIKGDFPVLGPPQEDYDYQGCSSVCATCGWMAAAKPFGAIDQKGLVLPYFRFARLVPLGTTNGCCTNLDDYEWLLHVRLHVPEYLRSGSLEHAGKCEYCKQLKTWQRSSFRRQGVHWLKWHKKTCRRGGGSRPGGNGSAMGH